MFSAGSREMATVRASCVARAHSGVFASGSRVGRGGKPRGALDETAEKTLSRNGKTKTNKKRSFIILPADGSFSDGAAGWTLWQESEAGSVLVGTRRARRRRQQMNDHWRKIMSLGGVEGAEPEDVARRLKKALETIEKQREHIAKTLHELERGNKGADVCALDVKRLKVQKLNLKDDALRIQKTINAATDASELGEGSFGRVFLGKDADGGGDVAVKVEDLLRASAVEGAIDEVQISSMDRTMDQSVDDDDTFITPLRLERLMLSRVVSVAGPAGFPKVHHFGQQKVFGRDSNVLVMDLLGPSLEEMSWACSAGGPLSATTTLMIADQALARIAACHRAGVIHRDVKPDNLLLGHPKRGKGANRAVHLVDFGLAAMGPAEGATVPTQTSEAMIQNKNNVLTKSTKNYSGTPAFSAAAADTGRPPTFSDDLEALVFTVSYLRAGTFPWTPPELRRDVLKVAEYKAKAKAENLALNESDQLWMGLLLQHARSVAWGKQFDLAFCRQVVRKAFDETTNGRRMRNTLFDWEEAGVNVVVAGEQAA